MGCGECVDQPMVALIREMGAELPEKEEAEADASEQRAEEARSEAT
jgi:hypothetical protein